MNAIFKVKLFKTMSMAQCIPEPLAMYQCLLTDLILIIILHSFSYSGYIKVHIRIGFGCEITLESSPESPHVHILVLYPLPWKRHPWESTQWKGYGESSGEPIAQSLKYMLDHQQMFMPQLTWFKKNCFYEILFVCFCNGYYIISMPAYSRYVFYE